MTIWLQFDLIFFTIQGTINEQPFAANYTEVNHHGKTHSAGGRWAAYFEGLGFKEACLDKRPDIKLLAKTIGNWSKAEAMCDMALWLQLFPKIDGVVAANDDMAIGAMQALKANNRLSGCLVMQVIL